MILKEITVKVTYKVGLGNIEMPKIVHDQLQLAAENFKELDPTMLHEDYREAADWLSQNIKESDCMDWVAEIDDISEPE